MAVFIADHTGLMRQQSAFFRPVHIGAALVDVAERGPEPDCLGQNSKSAKTAYADLRLHSYLMALDELPEIIAIMQYRRRFILTDKSTAPAWMHDASQRSGIKEPPYPEYRISKDAVDKYDRYLAQQTDDLLHEQLGQHRFLLPRFNMKKMSLGEQYIFSMWKEQPDVPEYGQVFRDALKIVVKMVGKEKLQRAVDQKFLIHNNCYVCRREDFLDYSRFLWSVLDELRQYEDVFRIFGYLGERLFSIYLTLRFQDELDENVRYIPMFITQS